MPWLQVMQQLHDGHPLLTVVVSSRSAWSASVSSLISSSLASEIGNECKLFISYFLNSSSHASSGSGDLESVSATWSSFPGL